MSTTRIVAAILDTSQLVLYKQNGETIEIPQGDTRIQRIIDEVTNPLSTQGWAEIDLGYANEMGNAYHDFEQQSGVVKLFRVAKRFVKKLFNPETDADHVPPVTLGQVPGPNKNAATTLDKPSGAPTSDQIRDATPNQKRSIQDATSEIMKNAKPVSDPNFRVSDHNSQDDTMIAVVDTPQGSKIVPGVEHLQNQMRVASKLGSTIGVENFLKRIAAVIDDRGHSIQELLNFMSRGDLPIADDGSIIGYKVLTTSSHNITVPKGYYVDCHSKKVLQRIGSLVQQNKVDPNRRTECSTGLHIARRGYLRGFSGNIITLVKIAPEDVIAVPQGEPDKMRARAYHILAEIPANEHERLRNNTPIEGMEAKRLLGAAIKGNHIGVIEDVVIHGGYGADVKVTLRNGGKTAAPVLKKDSHVAEALPDPDQKVGAAPVNAKAVSEQVTENKMKPANIPSKTEETRAQKVARLVDTMRSSGNPDARIVAANELISIKKYAKQPWPKLGVTEPNLIILNQLTSGGTREDNTPAPAPAPKPVAQPKKAKPKESKKATEVAKTVPNKTPKKGTDAKGASPEAAKVQEQHAATGSRQERVNALIKRIEGKSKTDAKAAYQELLALKKKAKVGWSVLGVSNFEAIQAKFEK